MPGATARERAPFVRRTSLGANEYHTNFRKVDCETISRLTSDEAGRVTSQMCKVYLSLLNAPTNCWEREGVLRFVGEERGGEWVTAWEQLVSLVGVASATARKALQWMHGQGIVGYFAGKNGVGIRIFMNRASSSIGVRAGYGQKNLRLVRTSTEASRASVDDTPFSDSFADLEILETDLNPRAPKDGAEQTAVIKKYPDPCPTPSRHVTQGAGAVKGGALQTTPALEVPFEEVVSRLCRELEPSLQSAARQVAVREHERTREWLESRGLPKAARVAQRETYKLLRRHNLIGPDGKEARACVAGRNDRIPGEARRLSPEELKELAETCVAMLEVHGRAFEVTLAEFSAEVGGPLLAEDIPEVRELAEAMIHACERG